MEALHKVSFDKHVFAMFCRQKKQGQRRHEDKDFVLTDHNARLPHASGRTKRVSDHSKKLGGLREGRFSYLSR